MDSLELYRQRLNWMWDYRQGRTEYQPNPLWNWRAYQIAYHDLCGSYWDSKAGQNYDVLSELEAEYQIVTSVEADLIEQTWQLQHPDWISFQHETKADAEAELEYWRSITP